MTISWQKNKSKEKIGKLGQNVNSGYLWVVGSWQYLYFLAFKVSTLSKYYFNNRHKLVNMFG